MAAMKRKGVIVISLLFINWGLASAYFESSRQVLSGFSSFLTICGALIETSFTSSAPGVWDYFFVIISIQIVIYTGFQSIKYLGGEKTTNNHIKYKILEE